MDYTSTMSEMPSAPTDGVSEFNGHRITRVGGQITIEGLDAQPRIPQQGEHDENLAELMSRSERSRLADRLIEFSKVDKESRKDWEEREKRALEIVGIKDIPKDSPDLSPGAHQTTHPLLAEAITHFQSRAIGEIFPSQGPVKVEIVGERTADKVAQADRVETFGNYYFRFLDQGYFHDTDQMLYYLPFSGSAFRKGGQNPVTGFPQLRYVKATNFIAPYLGNDLASMPRYCHEFSMYGSDIKRAQRSGMYLDTQLQKPSFDDARNDQTGDTADARNAGNVHEDDANYPILEYHIDLELDIDEKASEEDEDGIRGEPATLPYIVIVETVSRETLMIRRNWRENDPQRRKRIWFAHHRMFPGLGFYGFGYLHMLGSLGRSLNGTVNSLLDSAYAANFQGGFKTKSGRGLAGETRLEHGVWKDVDATYDELTKAFYTPPFKEPSVALFNLLGLLENAGKSFASITEAATGNADNKGPVGTTLALIEQSNIIPTAVHKRLHMSFAEEYRMWSELVYDFMPDQYDYEYEDQQRQLLKSDFDGRVDVLPVSDPNVWSSTQRIALAQSVLELQLQAPDLYQKAQRIAAHRRMLEALKVPDIESVAPQADSPKYLDPISENGLMLNMQPVRAYETQDQMAHLQAHQNGLQWAQNTMEPADFNEVRPVFMAHIREHQALYYRALVYQAAGLPPPPLDENGMPTELDPQTEAQLSAAVAQALPPPPPPQDQGDGQQMLTEADAQIQRDNMLADAERQRKDNAFAADEKRKDDAHAAEERRKNRALEAELERQDTKTAAELLRTDAAHQQNLDNTADAAGVKNKLAVDSAEAKKKAQAKSKPK